MRRIPGIYNYCTRWCERCSLGHRCSINDKHAGDEEWLKNLERKIEKAQEENNIFEEIDWEEVESAIEEEKLKEELGLETEEEEFEAREHHLYKQVEEVSVKIKLLLDNLEKVVKEREAKQAESESFLEDSALLKLDNCEQVLGWYTFFIQSKLYRALSGKHDGMGDLDPVQNDWNGSAKIVKIAANHCQGAVRQILDVAPSLEDQCLELLELIIDFQHALDEEFPRTDEFIRPGFDQLGVKEEYGV